MAQGAFAVAAGVCDKMQNTAVSHSSGGCTTCGLTSVIEGSSN